MSLALALPAALLPCCVPSVCCAVWGTCRPGSVFIPSPACRYSAQANNTSDTLLTFMIVVIFTTLQPIMHIIGLLYFLFRFLVVKTQVTFLDTQAAVAPGALLLFPAACQLGA